MLSLKRKSAASTLTVFALGLGIAVLSSGAAEARLLSAKLPAPNETNHEAVHLPTGCNAKVVMDEQTVVSASITDPNCLPKNVAARTVPGERKDFRFLPIPFFR